MTNKEALSCSEIPNSSDCISRQDAIDAAECIIDHHSITPYETMRSAIDHLKRIIDGMPSAEPEREKGKWIICSDGYYPYCSNCRHEPESGFMTDFCPNCGADMRGKQDE